jgi:exo-beta-1,3-glucanase (GH17 family)
MAQMTPAIRLYGTDCNQTELVLKGIDLLGYNDTVKVWLGVWLANNQTTNTRQLNQMYDILDKYPEDHFAGVIVGNEVLFREDLTITQLANELSKVKSNLSKKGISLPVSTSDLGDDWTQALASDSDIVMSNVHPFFAGVTPDKAPGWTWEFWQTHDVILKAENGANYPTNIISETGWPSQGGNDCGTGAKCATKTEGAIAGIDELNEFMDGWVCQSMANGTTYFWFEAFDVSDTSYPC